MMYSSTAAPVSADCSWLCSSEKQISDVLSTTKEKNNLIEDHGLPHDRRGHFIFECEAVCLERAEEGAPCVVTLRCSPSSGSVISGIQLVSEARTIEVYSADGEYCGTCRGEELLSLGGRSSVAIAHLCVKLDAVKGRPAQLAVDPGIDLQRVQTMMEEMGTTLSPGAQNLMEMVQCQQKVWFLYTTFWPV
ncbi:hypothetical protein DNTS_033921 [Danionella cerebrum]|uniref:Uncharacterized protein n=1 Tax=Danionella cerebrum TaxID=2873325 RepID=A0A553N0J8_9TELE|nr:hypothetical protein DNTS_033921 [Danionella translucida]